MNHVRTELHFLSTEYPQALRDLANPPKSIFVEGGLVEGRLGCVDRPVLGVVGARDSSVMSEAWMRRHLPLLAEKYVIVSGGARGIDELAHQIAIHQKASTIVVLPSGLDRPYPSTWSSKKTDVMKHGGYLLSEYSPDVRMRRWHFEQRNRLIAALSDVVLVVEGRRRSGTGITARHARDLGRVVAALPWFPSDPRGELCNDLIAEGAILVRDAADITALLEREAHGRLLRALRVIGTPQGEPRVRFDSL